MAKIFKNVHTILEKVRNGELENKTSSPLYSNLQYYKRKDIITPYLHSLDESALHKAVDHFMAEGASHNDIRMILLCDRSNQFNNGGQYPTLNQDILIQDMLNIWKKFPRELVGDIFNLNFQDIQKLSFETRSLVNRVRYQIIEKANLNTSKVTTRYSHVKSMLFTRSIIQYYIMMLAILKQTNEDEYNKVMDNLKQANKPGSAQNGGSGKSSSSATGAGDGTATSTPISPDDDPLPLNKTIVPFATGVDPDMDSADEFEDDDMDTDEDPADDEAPHEVTSTENHNPNMTDGVAGKGTNVTKDLHTQLENIMTTFDESPVAQQMLESVLNEAKVTSERLTAILTDNEMDELWEGLNGKYKESELACNKMNSGYLSGIEQTLRSVNMNLNGIKASIQKLLDKSLSYFSAKEIPYYENLFDTGNVGGFQDFELFHPILRKLSVEDMNVKETRKAGKIDIYVDCSGSMSSSCGIKDENGRYMTRLLFAKAFVYKMKQMNLLNNVFSFQSTVKFEGNKLMDILSMSEGGCTSFHSVIRSIEKMGRNAIIITDAEDRCEHYTEKAFFIGTLGAQYRDFHRDYLKNKQTVIFDGFKIHHVDMNGNIIKT